MACDTPEAKTVDPCVAGGTWAGVWAKPDAPGDVRREDGALVYTEGLPRIPGCDEVRFMWKPASASAAAEVEPKNGSMKMGKGTRIAQLSQGSRSFVVTLTQKTLQLQVKEGKEKRTLDLRPVLGESLKVADSVMLGDVGDINGDGAPEAIVALDTRDVVSYLDKAGPCGHFAGEEGLGG